MTDNETRLWVEKCGEILYLVLIEIRMLSFQPGNEQRINDLADLTHNLPRFMIGRDEFVLSHLREDFVRHALKHQPGQDPATDRYVSILDVDEATFTEVYRRTS